MHGMLQFVRQMSGKLGSGLYAGISGQSNPAHISFLRQLQKEMKESDSLDVPLSELESVVFDLETTGFYPDKGDKIVSIGAVKMDGDKIVEDHPFYSLIKQDVPITAELSQLLNITNEELLEAPLISEVLVEFYKYIKGRILVAHHAKHEIAFMQRTSWDLLRANFEHRIVDTTFLIRLEKPHIKTLSLEECCEECGIPIIDRHHALGDAKTTATIWSHYSKKAQKLGFQTLRDVYEHLAKYR